MAVFKLIASDLTDRLRYKRLARKWIAGMKYALPQRAITEVLKKIK